MYRVAKKTTKNTVNHCLKCKYSKELRQIVGGGVIIECTAENRCIITEFNPRDYYCVEYKGANDMTQAEKDSILKKHHEKEALKNFREYANKYYCKKQAISAISAFREKQKRG